jgi:hypothetical protein
MDTDLTGVCRLQISDTPPLLQMTNPVGSMAKTPPCHMQHPATSCKSIMACGVQ